MVGGLPRSAKAIGGLLVDISSKRCTHGTIVKPDAIPDAERELATRAEHAPHLPKGKQFIRKKLQSLLTENYVKGGIRQLKIERAPLKPFDCGAKWVGSDRATAIIPGLRSTPTMRPVGPTRSAATRATTPSRKQHPHALAHRQTSGIDQQRRPRCEDVSAWVPLV